MYQSFETPSHDHGAARLADLRAELERRGLSGFIVPRADAHQGEYVPARDERLRWLTGFTGSAGQAIAMPGRAGVFVDGRYTIQAATQLDGAAFETVAIAGTDTGAWLGEVAGPGDVVGFDPWLVTPQQRDGYAEALEAVGASLRAEPDNPVDAVWPDQPPAPMGSAQIHPEKFAGTPSDEKRQAVAGTLADQGVEGFVLTLPDSINWLLNIRGSDLSHTPVMLSDALLHADGSVDLFLDLDKLDGAVRAHLGDDVRLHATARFLPMLRDAGLARVGLEKASVPVIVETTLREAGAGITWMRDPCIMPKARKNPAEQAGARTAHLRDGAAMARFLCWLDRKAGDAELKEIKVAKRLEKYRHETGHLQDISFDTISAYGPNGAQPHYRVSRETNLPLSGGSLYLIDSGGQYPDGTTDITRVVAIGTPQDRHRRAFTLVLRGMIAVSRALFPAGTTGVQIDAMARMPLWSAGLDFDHGTGHGVGSYLGVHEGPASLSKRGTVALEPGMILSNEPGYYKEGDFGIRIENLLLVTPPAIPEGGEREMMAFETLTLAPIDLRLVDPDLLRADEIAWLDDYHERVYDALYPVVDATTQDWLETATMRVEQFAAKYPAALPPTDD